MVMSIFLLTIYRVSGFVKNIGVRRYRTLGLCRSETTRRTDLKALVGRINGNMVFGLRRASNSILYEQVRKCHLYSEISTSLWHVSSLV